MKLLNTLTMKLLNTLTMKLLNTLTMKLLQKGMHGTRRIAPIGGIAA